MPQSDVYFNMSTLVGVSLMSLKCPCYVYARVAQQLQLLNLCGLHACHVLLVSTSCQVLQHVTTSNRLDWQNWHGVHTINPSDSFLLLHANTATPAKRLIRQNTHRHFFMFCLCSVHQTKMKKCQMRQVLKFVRRLSQHHHNYSVIDDIRHSRTFS